MALASVTATLFAPVLVKLTAPTKLFAGLVSVIVPAPAFTVTAPAPAACVSAPVCVSAPFDCSARVPVPTVTVPSASAFASRSDTAFAPVLARLTAPTKSFATLLSVIAPAPAFTVTAPAPAACVIAPVCVSAPFD